MKKLTEGFNMDAFNIEYIITKDYKFEEMRTTIKVSESNSDKKASTDKEKLDAVVSIKIDSYEKFDSIKLPEGFNNFNRKRIKRSGNLLLFIFPTIFRRFI